MSNDAFRRPAGRHNSVGPDNRRPGSKWRMMLPLACVFALAFPRIAAFADPPAAASSSSGSTGDIKEPESKQPGAERPELGEPDAQDFATVDPQKYDQHLIDIVSANYGNSNGFTFCPAKRAVKRMCDGRHRCSIKIDDDLCPSDLLQKVLIATLTVRYRCSPNEHPRLAAADRPFRLQLSCDKFLKPPN